MRSTASMPSARSHKVAGTGAMRQDKPLCSNHRSEYDLDIDAGCPRSSSTNAQGRISRRMPLRPRKIVLELPAWIGPFVAQRGDKFDSGEARMRLAIELARRNVEHKTGGPFGAAIFESDSGRLVSVGVNLVEISNCSIAHAEMVALALAQRAIGSYDLGRKGRPVHELATSTEPCAMCLGAIPWSGVRRVLCGARSEDACAIGFDEGAKPADWVGALSRRGIEVVRDILREEACAVLRQYADMGGTIY